MSCQHITESPVYMSVRHRDRADCVDCGIGNLRPHLSSSRRLIPKRNAHRPECTEAYHLMICHCCLRTSLPPRSGWVFARGSQGWPEISASTVQLFKFENFALLPCSASLHSAHNYKTVRSVSSIQPQTIAVANGLVT